MGVFNTFLLLNWNALCRALIASNVIDLKIENWHTFVDSRLCQFKVDYLNDRLIKRPRQIKTKRTRVVVK